MPYEYVSSKRSLFAHAYGALPVDPEKKRETERFGWGFETVLPADPRQPRSKTNTSRKNKDTSLFLTKRSFRPFVMEMTPLAPLLATK